MVASIIAKDLGREMIKVDLSRIIDKYVGETEKNLKRLFSEATDSQAVILFDEADSLFSKRTDVKSSNDRYANIAVNYLLQLMESYEGICILTTNFESSIDEAFLRRLRFRIAFPHPDLESRILLWRCMLPEQADVEDDIYWEGLAEDFPEMAGGHIRNAVLRAAFLAAAADTAIHHEHLYQAARSEYAELGHAVRHF
ncbi:MAG: ATP-binding protein [Myxococcota bacterium]